MTTHAKLDIPQLPLPFMNEDHALAARQMEEMIAALDDYDTRPERLASACAELLKHSREHFAREEAAMQEAGFPPYPVHKAEHDRVLGLLERLADDVAAGRLGEATRQTIAEDLPAWLIHHAGTIDAVTARWISARSG